MPKDMPDQEEPTQENEDQDKPIELLEHPSYQALLAKLDEAESKAQQNLDRMLRVQAESENVQRRAEREVSNAHKYALEKFAGELLPIIDSLELSISKVPHKLDNIAASILEGVKLTLKMFYSAMEKFGIKQVDPLNQPFNPEFEQAIKVQYDPDVAPNTVVSVLQKGYTLNNRLLRPALVIVSKADE